MFPAQIFPNDRLVVFVLILGGFTRSISVPLVLLLPCIEIKIIFAYDSSRFTLSYPLLELGSNTKVKHQHLQGDVKRCRIRQLCQGELPESGRCGEVFASRCFKAPMAKLFPLLQTYDGLRTFRVSMVYVNSGIRWLISVTSDLRWVTLIQTSDGLLYFRASVVYVTSDLR